ncbi:MAG TPA: hypothetical protein DCZ75_01075 [Geobacter sp.]|nr:hypothetical protein [Geobacter sp.]
MNLRRVTIYLSLGLVTLVAPRWSEATLGEPAESIARDGEALSAVARSSTSRTGYTIAEISSATTCIREYVTTSGTVFAVAWNGLAHPDLSVLLGSYNQEYRDALGRQPRRLGRRQTQVKSDRVVVETWGHMRNLQGRAYLPELVPEGVSLYDIH